MHPGEFPVGADLARRLLAAQFPHWASLPYFTLVLPADADRAVLLERARTAGVTPEDHDGRPLLRDRDGNAVVVDLA